VNNQKPVTKFDDNGLIQVHSIFHTIQGEGIYVGTPSIFVRLYGCNLQCPLCDTDYTSSKHSYTIEDLVSKTVDVGKETTKLVVITGGEPLLQDIGEFISLLVQGGYTVQIETNGTIFNNSIDYSECTVVCSPKMGYVHKDLQPFVTHYKYVGSADTLNRVDGLPDTVLGLSKVRRVFRPPENSLIYLQPTDDKCTTKNNDNMKACVDSCLEHGYKLCIQTHKIIGVE
jgi:7-carboxy-7-deazaguanine synthase